MIIGSVVCSYELLNQQVQYQSSFQAPDYPIYGYACNHAINKATIIEFNFIVLQIMTRQYKQQ